MAGGFTAPSILFLSTWDQPERSFCKAVFAALPSRGYNRYVEPCAGGFAMPLVAAAAGWKTEQMECSDVGLYSAVIGTMLDPELKFDALDIRIDGSPVDPGDGTKVDQAARLLYTQLLVRFEVKPSVEYWLAMVADLRRNEAEHVAAIRERLVSMDDRLHGIRYVPMDLWDHMDRVKDDPQTVVSINAPTFLKGFERFFDTKGRLTWAEPTYVPYDPIPGGVRQLELFATADALLISQQQLVPGSSANAVHARHLSPGQYVYVKTNRPAEVYEITGGPRVAVKSGTVLESADYPTMPPDAEITSQSRIDLLPVKATVADWYRGLWMHRLNASPGSYNVLVLVDGQVAGVLGYSIDSMSRPYHSDVWSADYVLLRFAFGAPHHSFRTTRLITALALQRKTAQLVLAGTAGVWLEASDGLMTAEMTRHPEIKGLRGLMKLQSRTKHPDGYKLMYVAPWDEGTPKQALATWLRKEATWSAQRTA
jgi:hypothetical protein